MHLVSVLAERQIAPLERHIHQVPEEENVEEHESEENSGGGAHRMLERCILIIFLTNDSIIYYSICKEKAIRQPGCSETVRMYIGRQLKTDV